MLRLKPLVARYGSLASLGAALLLLLASLGYGLWRWVT